MTTNDVINLFKGVGVIIDDNINKPNSNDDILKIFRYFKNKQLPILVYKKLPDNGIIQSFKNVSFIVLDWNLQNLNPIPTSLVDDNINFIKAINKIGFIPIFIFTDEEPNSIELILENNGLFQVGKSNNIFVKSKSEIKSGKILFSLITKWVKQTPSLYVMKKWANITQLATTQLFHELQNISPNWTYIMMKTYNEDVGADNSEIGNLLFNNLKTTCVPLQLDESITYRRKNKVSKEELRKLLEREKYITKDKLLSYPALGDIYKDGKKYYFNFRPDCDLVRDDNPEIYLVTGMALEPKDYKGHNPRYRFYKGTFLERVDSSVVPFIDDGKIIVFKFKRIKRVKWKEFESKRIGRLLPPYSIRLKSQLLSFLQRQAIPSIPNKAVKD